MTDQEKRLADVDTKLGCIKYFLEHKRYEEAEALVDVLIERGK